MNTSMSLLECAGARAEPDGWDRLEAVYAPLLRKWLNRYDVAPNDADDLTQETLLFVCEELPNFEHNGRQGAFRCWLRQILVNRLRTFWAKRSRQPTATGNSDFLAELEQLEDPSSELSRLWDRRHDEHVCAELLKQVRQRFEDSTWKAFQMTVFENRKPADVAEILGMSPNSVCAAKCRVLRALREKEAGLLD